jgi:hypothetical protein
MLSVLYTFWPYIISVLYTLLSVLSLWTSYLNRIYGAKKWKSACVAHLLNGRLAVLAKPLEMHTRIYGETETCETLRIVSRFVQSSLRRHWMKLCRFMQIYSGASRVAFTTMGIVIQVNPLPACPHPVSIDHVPLALTDDREILGGLGPPVRYGTGPSILTHLDLRGQFFIPEPILDTILESCHRLAIPLDSITNTFGDALVMTLKRPHSPLPLRIATARLFLACRRTRKGCW